VRVTAEAKAETRQRILETARQLFAASGYEASTTREIADAVGIAHGTLFNYFPNKEAVLATLVADATAGLHIDFDRRSPEEGSFEEELFAFVAAGLRKLKPWRKQLSVLLETVLNPLTTAAADGSESMRLWHLETVARLAKHHGLGDLPPVSLQLYWTLYIGLLLFWSQDGSPRQEDTLALLDSSLAMFTGWLQSEKPSPSPNKKGRV
jgi:AcrR family transcriptional regulator